MIKMKNKSVFLGVFVIVAVLLFSGCIGTEDEPEMTEMETLEAMQASPPENYVEEMETIIETTQDPYIKERGLLTLTDVALRKNETEEIVDYLKEKAMNEEDDDVRTTAYASIDLIRSQHPLESKGTLEISISGDIKKGSDITLIAEVSSTVDIEKPVIVGITRLHNSIELLSETGIEKLSLKANEPKEVEFDLLLTETGEYFVPVAFMMSFDSIDYEKIKKEVRLVVNENDGEFEVWEDV
jgi:hypothetical protein